MGTSYNNHDSNLQLVTVPTEKLRNLLNQIYDLRRENPKISPDTGLFDYFWDLKEKSLQEGCQSLQVPTKWLKELEEFEENSSHASHGILHTH